MNKIIKYIFISAILFAVLLFTGCAEVLIKAEITPENLVTYSYTIKVNELDDEDDNYNELEDMLLSIDSHWQDLGFESEYISEGETATLICTMEKQCENREDAFKTLHEFMSNEISLFDSADYTYNQNFYKEEYTVSAVIDLSGIITEDVNETYPAVVGEDVAEYFDKIKCSAEFNLPFNESTEVDSLSISNDTFEISFVEPTEIAVSGIINNIENKVYEENILQRKAEQTSKLYMFIGIAVLGLILAAVFVVLFLKSKKKEDNKPIDESLEIADASEETSEDK